MLYAALDFEGAFLEVVVRDSSLGRDLRLLSRRFLASRMLSMVEFDRPLRLVDISEDGATLLGADARISIGGDYAIARAWSRAIWQHPDRPDGICYTSRHNTRMRSVAIFRRRNKVEGLPSPLAEPAACAHESPLGTFLEWPYVRLLDKYEIGLA